MTKKELIEALQKDPLPDDTVVLYPDTGWWWTPNLSTLNVVIETTNTGRVLAYYATETEQDAEKLRAELAHGAQSVNCPKTIVRYRKAQALQL